MTPSETDIQSLSLVAMSKHATMFRNNVGVAVVKPDRCPSCRKKIPILRRIRYGLCEGSSDTVGWKSVTITEEMVGEKVAVFCGAEIKTPTGKATLEQMNFVTRVNAAGGRAGFARSPEEAVKIVKGEVT